MALQAKLPPDLEKLAKKAEENKRFALHMVDYKEKSVPRTGPKVKELIEKATAKKDVEQSAEDTSSTGEPEE